jgi:hypothetical protein
MDVYLNTRRELLVVQKGFPIPHRVALGSWRKSKRRVAKVSEEIRSALEQQGYYMRKLRDAKERKLAKSCGLPQRALVLDAMGLPATALLTTPPNAVVEPIHPKAMPVILLTDEERDV